MTITLSEAAVDASNDAIVDLLDVGATNPGARMVIMTAADAVIGHIEVSDPAFDDSTGGVATLRNTPLQGTASATGIAAKFDMVDRDETVVYSGTVGISGSGADAIIDDDDIQLGDTIQLNSHTITV